MPDLQKTLGYRYLHDTKFTRKNIREKERPVITPAPAFKDYPAAEKIDLPADTRKSRRLISGSCCSTGDHSANSPAAP